MFINLSKEKILKISSVCGVIVLAVYFSLGLNNKYKITNAYDLYTRKTSGEISYFLSNKLVNYLKDPKSSLAAVFGLGSWEYETVLDADEKRARSIPVLIYHGLPDEGLVNNPFNERNFLDHMSTLKKAGWRTISLEQFRRFIRGEIDLPEKSFLLTFDDGRKDTYYPSDPILKDLGYEAVMFAITKRSLAANSDESSYYLSEYELQDMEKSNHWEVESHGRDSHDWYSLDNKETIGHFFSNRLWLSDQNRLETEEEFRERIRYDLTNSKKDLEAALGKEVSTFAYPFSDFGQDSINFSEANQIVLDEVSKVYDMAFYQTWEGAAETFNYPSDSNFMMRRIEPPSSWNGKDLLAALESGISKDLPYKPVLLGKEWVKSWGNALTKEASSTIELMASKDTSGATIGLNGSSWWRNYLFTADVDWQDGSNVVLIGRRGDDDNYFGCNFGKSKISIKSYVNRASYNILNQNYSLPKSGEANLGIKVEGSNISCLVNGEVVLEGKAVNSRILNGGIGMEVWDPVLGKAKVIFSNISVIPL